MRMFREDDSKPPSGRYYVLDGIVYQFAKGSRWGVGEEGQVALCPRGHRVSALVPPV